MNTSAMGATPSSGLRAAIAQCWNTQCLLLLALGLLALMSSAIKDDFGRFFDDPGQSGWQLFCFVLPVYAVMPWLVRLTAHRAFRQANAVLLLLTALAPIGHQAKHLGQGQMPDLSVVVELAMLLCGLAGTWLGLRWCREERAA